MDCFAPFWNATIAGQGPIGQDKDDDCVDPWFNSTELTKKDEAIM